MFMPVAISLCLTILVQSALTRAAEPAPVFLLSSSTDAAKKSDLSLGFWENRRHHDDRLVLTQIPGPTLPISWLLIRTRDGQQNFHGVDTAPGCRLDNVELDVVHSTLIGFELPPYEQDGSVVIRCGTTIIAPADTRGAGGGYLLAQTGQTAQLRLMIDPTSLSAPCDLLVEVSLDTIDPAGLTMTAVNRETGEAVTARVDDAGLSRLSIPTAGRWCMSVRGVERLPTSDSGEPVRRILIPTLVLSIGGSEEVVDE